MKPVNSNNAFIVAVMSLAVAVWPLAFNLGVYNTILYHHLFTILAVSLAIIFTNLCFCWFSKNRFGFGGVANVVLAIPSLWLLAEISLHDAIAPFPIGLKWVLALTTGMVSLPYIVYFIVMNLIPGMERITETKDKIMLGGIVIAIALLGYVSGEYHHLILTCEDFHVAGSLVPGNCWDG